MQAFSNRFLMQGCVLGREDKMKLIYRYYKIGLSVFACVGFFYLLAGKTNDTTTPVRSKMSASFEEPTEPTEIVEESIYRRRGKVVILYSNQRSGSTFIGEFFNKNRKAFYMFEPLFPYSLSCSKLYEERLRTLRNISICDFRELPGDYRQAHQATKYLDHAAKCLVDNICFGVNHQILLHRYSSLCYSLNNAKPSEERLRYIISSIGKFQHEASFKRSSKTCGYPLNMTLLSSVCYTSPIVAYKVLRVCDLKELEWTYRELTSMGNDVYVVHLVRDPRAIINSALNLELKPQHVAHRAEVLCGRLITNIHYIKEEISKRETGDSEKRSIIADGRYLRVRHEDISMDPIAGAKQIYEFIGLTLPSEVREWIEESAIDPNEKIIQLKSMAKWSNITVEQKLNMLSKIRKLTEAKNSPYGTARNPQEVLSKWRKSLSIELIAEIQANCADVMSELGYKLIHSKEGLEESSKNLW